MIKIFTDTSANLPAELIKKHGLTVVGFSYSVNGVEVKEDPEADFDGKAFYGAMREGAQVKTAMVNIGTFTEAMDAELSAGNDIIYIGMSGGISGTAHAARVAAEDLSEIYPERRIAVIDTLAASLGEGLQVLEAAEMLEAGASFDGIVDTVNKKRLTMCQYFTVDDLEYLKRGGRISKVASVVGTVLRIKPLLTGNDEGRIVLCGKARGRRQSLMDLAERYDALVRHKDERIGIAHADDEAGAAILLGLLRSKGFTGECITVCYEPVTGAHVGPGTVALFFRGIHK